MKRFLLLALTAGLLSPIASEAESVWLVIAKRNDFFKTNFTHTVQMLDMKQCKKLSSYLHKNLIYKKKDTDFSFFSCAIGEWKITRVEWLHLLFIEQLKIDIQVIEARQ